MSLVLASHLLCVNVGSTLPLLCVYFERDARRRGSGWSSRLGRRLAAVSLVALLIGGVIGVILGILLWAQSGDPLINILPRFSRKIGWGIAELIFSVVCLGAYWILWSRAMQRGFVWIVAHRVLAVVGTTNLLYHFPALFGAMAYVARRPHEFSESIGSAEFRSIIYSGPVASLWVHFLLASLAVSGVFSMCVISRMSTSEQEKQDARRAIRFAAGVALLSTALQILVGVWVLLQLDPLQQRNMLGADAWATAMFGASVLLTFVLLHYLASAVFGNATKRDIRKIALIIVVVVCLMTATLRRSRVQPPTLPSVESIQAVVSPTAFPDDHQGITI